MPNHVKNRLEFIGDDKTMNLLFEKFNTHNKEAPYKTHDGKIICKEKENVGWYDEEKKELTVRNGSGFNTIDGLPDGWKYEMNKAWDRFPDFNKIIKMPESLSIESGSNGDLGLFVLTGEKDSFMSNEEMMKRFWVMSSEQKETVLKTGQQYADNIKNHGCKTWYDWSCDNWGTKWNSYACEKITNNMYEFETAWSSIPDLVEIMSKAFPEIEIKYSWADEDTGCNCGIATYKNGVQSKVIPENCSNEAYELAFSLRPDYKDYYKKDDNGNYVYLDDE